jgi:alpha-tubulin suppressor-like RCC1 family protein
MWVYSTDYSYLLNGNTAWIDGITIPVTKWISVAAGWNHTVAVKSDGTLWAWGYNYYGQLGDGSVNNKSTPTRIGTDSNWVSVAAGFYHTVGLKADGTLWAWGYNGQGQLGIESIDSSAHSLPVQITAAGNGWVSLAAGDAHTTAVKSDGTVWTWGDNSHGQVGDWTTTNRVVPTETDPAHTWSSVGAGGYHTVAVKSDGTLWAWGNNDQGQLGDGTAIGKWTPEQIGTDTGWAFVAARNMSSLGVKKTDGSLWAWGYNTAGQLGDGTSFSRTEPVQIGSDAWTTIAAGHTHMLGIKSDGSLWAWGDNGNGCLGDGTQTLRSSPVPIAAVSTWATVAGGYHHSVAVKSDGTLWAWGDNYAGQVGDGTTASKLAPTQITTTLPASPANNWVSVAAGNYHTVAVKSDGTLWAWGRNSYGQLGDGTTNDSPTPTPKQVGSSADWSEVFAAFDHTVAVKKNGELWIWGRNIEGQLGDGTGSSTSNPERIDAALTIVKQGYGSGAVACNGGACAGIYDYGTTLVLTATPNGYSSFGGWIGCASVAGNTCTINLTQPLTTVYTTFNDTSSPIVTGSSISIAPDYTSGGGTKYTKNTTLNLTLTASDPVNSQLSLQMRFNVNGAGWTSWEPYVQSRQYQLSNPADGTYTVQVQFQDPSLNLSAIASDTVTLKRTGPTGGSVTIATDYLNSSTSKRYVRSSTFNLSLGAADITSVAEMQFSNDGVAWTSPEPYVTSKAYVVPAGSGDKTVYIKFKDNVGNWSGETHDTVIYDPNPPTGSIVINSDAQYTKSPTVNLTMTCVDNLAGCSQMQFSTDGVSNWSAAETYTAAKTNYLLNDGPGTVSMWGLNSYGQLGLGNFGSPANDKHSPQQIGADNQWSLIVPGVYHTVAIRSDGTLWTWGYNNNGQLGLGTSGAGTDKTTPQQVGTDATWIAVTAGTSHTLALKADGTLWAWGNNAYGQLGDTTYTQRTSPVQVASTYKWKSIAAGDVHSAAIRDDGMLFTWGYNYNGQLGDPSGSSSNVPKNILFGTTWKSIGAGLNHTTGIKTDGTLWTWGYNQSGQLGLGTAGSPTYDKYSPQQVGIDTDWSTVAPGGNHTLALKNSGSLYAWGMNSSGQLGDGTTTLRNSPVLVASGTVWKMVAAGSTHSAGIKSDNSLWAWGDNSYGELGDGSSTNRAAPVPIDAANKWRSVAATNGNNTAAIKLSDSKYVFAKFSDNLGNWSVSYSDSIILDTVPPGTPIVTGPSLTNNPKPTWTWSSGSGGIGYYRFKLDGDGSNMDIGCTEGSVTSFTPSGNQGEGTHTLYVQEIDAANNWSATGSFTLTIDITAPSPPTVSGPSPTNNQTPTWTWTSGSGGSGQFQFQLGSAVPSACPGASPWTTVTSYTPAGPLTTDGPYTLYVREKDLAGNCSGSQPFTIDVDTTPPGVPLNNNSTQSPSNNRMPTWNWKSGGGGITLNPVYYFRLDNPDLSDIVLTNFGAITSFTPSSNLDDGPHTLFVQEKDAAGNWSGSASFPITVDSVPPTGSIVINNGAINTTSTSVNLTLSCNDSTSGCSRMQFSNDGSNWGTTWPADGNDQPVSTSKTNWPLSPANGTKTVSVRYYDVAGNPITYSNTIFLDDFPPTTKASPEGSLYSSFAKAQTVTLSCSDGSGVDGDGTNGTPGCAWIKYTLDGSDPKTSNTAIFYSSPISIAKNLDLKFFSKDSLGNSEPVVSETYTFIPGYTRLSLEQFTPVIDFGGSVTVFGRLQNMTITTANPIGNDADPTGEKITITIQPVATTLDPTPAARTVDTYIYNKAGQFNQVLTGFDNKRSYIISTSFGGSSLLSPSDSAGLPLLVGASAGYAILVEGKLPGPNPEGLASHNKTTNRIYQKLKSRGFVDENIDYFNYDTNNPTIVDNTAPLKSDIQYAVQSWAKSRMNGLPAPLYIIMVDHGSVGEFKIDNEIISPTNLGAWLTTLEAGLDAEALLEKRIVIIGSCFSGSFIEKLSKGHRNNATSGLLEDAGRVIITSSAPDEVSYKGPLEGDGIRSGEYFLEELFTQMERGQTIRDSFIEASSQTRTYTQKGGASSNSNAPYFDGAVQHPMLDDNGDHAGSNSLNSDPTQDGATVASMVLGVGVGHSTNSAINPAEIDQVTPSVHLSLGQSTAQLWATVNDTTQVDTTVWVEIRNMTQELATTTGTEQVALNTTKIPMALNTAGTRYEVTVTNLTETGRYDVYYFVRDRDTLKLAPMKRSVIYHNFTDDPLLNPPPPAPDMANAEPPNGSHRSTSLYFGWGAVSDSTPAHPPITYSLLISENPNPTYANAVYFRDNIPTNNTVVGPEGKLAFDKTYYWRVRAIDRYGAYSESAVMTFDTFFDQNADVIVLQGIVKDAVTSAPIRASVTVTNAALSFNRVVVADVDGSYSFTNLGITGPVTVTTRYSGYADDIWPITIVSKGRLTTYPHDVPLALPNATHALTVTVDGVGSGTVTSSPQAGGGISCQSGNCSASFPATQQVALTATRSFGSVFSGWTCIGCTTDGLTCTLATMNTDKSVAAQFDTTPPFFLYSVSPTPDSYRSVLQDAYDAAADNSNIQMQVTVPAGGLTVTPASGKTVTIQGGYDADYTPNPSGTFTVIQGKVTLQNGTLRVERVKIK